MTSQAFKAKKISENVYWVGAIDWTLEEFHGYKTELGSTYNAFLVIDEKITLIDTVHKPHYNQLVSRIASVIDPEKIDIIISNHAEMDHSGSLPQAIKDFKPEKVYASAKGYDNLKHHYGAELEVEAVENGGQLNIGKGTFTFVETRMIHWPDSMVSYLDSDKVLFSQDAFGMHMATTNIEAKQHDKKVLAYQAEKYYANIVAPYSKQVAKVLDSLPGLGLDIDIVAPDHGPLWTSKEDIAWILEQYKRFVTQEFTPVASVVFSSMWHSTEKLAYAVAEGLADNGVKPRVFDLAKSHRSDVATEVFASGALVVGSCTLNSGIFPQMADQLTYLRGLKMLNKVGGIFGSYGWNKLAFKELKGYMDAMKVELVADNQEVQFCPEAGDMETAYELGANVAKALLERC